MVSDEKRLSIYQIDLFTKDAKNTNIPWKNTKEADVTHVPGGSTVLHLC